MPGKVISTPHHPPYTLVLKMTRSGTKPLSDFLQFRKNHRWGTIFGICLPDLAVKCLNFCNYVPHYLNKKLIDMGAEDLIPQILMSKATSEVS